MFGASYLTDAIGLLKDDHRQVEDLLERFEASVDVAQKLELAQEICQTLVLHMHAEEQLFYPALREAGMDAELLDEALVEHDAVRALIAEIDGADAGAERFQARVHVLGEYLHHHIEEEEREIMPEARSLGIDLDVLGEQILALRTRLEARVNELSHVPGRGGRIEVLQVDAGGVRQP